MIDRFARSLGPELVESLQGGEKATSEQSVQNDAARNAQLNAKSRETSVLPLVGPRSK